MTDVSEQSVSAAMVDAGAKYLRETQQAGKRLTPWDSVPRATKKKWLELSQGVLSAALLAAPRAGGGGMSARMCPKCRENVADDQVECPFCDAPTMLHSDRDNWREHAANSGVRQRADGAYFGEPEWCRHGRNKLAQCDLCDLIENWPRGYSGVGI